MSDHSGGMRRHNDMIPHPNLKRLATIQATTVNVDLQPRKQPAHGQRLQTSLGVALHVVFYGYDVLCRKIGEGCP